MQTMILKRKNETSLVVLFQDISISTVIASLWDIRCARQIILFRPYMLTKSERVRPRTRIALWLIKVIKPSVKITDVDKKILFPLAYVDNYESEAYIEDAAKCLSNMPSRGIVRDIVGSDMVDRIYKRHLLDRILPLSQFYRYVKKIKSDNPDLAVVLSSEDYFDIHKYFFEDNEFHSMTAKGAYFFNKLIRNIKRGLSVLLLLNGFILLIGSGAIYLIKNMHRMQKIGSKPKAKIKFDVIMPLTIGLNEDNSIYDSRDFSKAQKTSWDNSFIFDKRLNEERVALFFDQWTFSPVNMARQCEIMDGKGIKYFDSGEFYLSIGDISFILRTMAKIMWRIILRPKIFLEPYFISRISSSIIYSYLKATIFNNHVDYRVYVEWADYSPQSIMRTVLANALGRITVGFHHSAPSGPYGFPQIRYTYINKLCVWGNALRRMYGRHWDVMDCRIVGIPCLDHGFKALDPYVCKELKTRYRERFGEKGPIVLIVMPNPPAEMAYQIESNFEKFLKGLLRCCSELPIRLVFRPRFAEHWKIYSANETIQKIQESNKSIVDSLEFSTYEWLAVSDLVITTTTTSVFIEASKMGKRCFTFDVRGLAEAVFENNYGKDLVLKTEDDVFRAVSGLFNNFEGFSSNQKRLADDYCAFMDDRNAARFRDVIYESI